jgi:leader peptidase (prepilin peptidase)/N-methyltransferase
MDRISIKIQRNKKNMDLLIVVFLGLMVGSYLNVVIYRVPKGISTISPSRSFCPLCEKKIAWYHNMPILSWLFLKGLSSCCAKPIPKRYILVELAVLLIFYFTYNADGFNLHSFLIALSLTFFFALSLMDFDDKLIPDSINLLTLTLAVAGSDLANPLYNPFYSALTMAGAFALLRFFASYVFKKEALGEADIMIAATMGALLDTELALKTVFLSQLILLVVIIATKTLKKDTEFAMAPSLFVATLISYFFGDLIKLAFNI